MNTLVYSASKKSTVIKYNLYKYMPILNTLAFSANSAIISGVNIFLPLLLLPLNNLKIIMNIFKPFFVKFIVGFLKV